VRRARPPAGSGECLTETLEYLDAVSSIAQQCRLLGY
jgi:hypothetical protein